MEKYKRPNFLLSDRGRQFITVEFKKFLEQYQTTHIMTTAHNPACNGIVERINRQIEDVLRQCKNTNINDLEQKIYKRLNKSYQSAIKDIPYEIQFANSIFENRILEEEITVRRQRVSEINNRPSKINVGGKAIYRIGDTIYSYLFPTNKMEKQWRGSLVVLRVEMNNEWVEVKDRGKIQKINTKNIRK